MNTPPSRESHRIAIAPIINEHLQIKAEIKKLRQRYVKISNLAKLVAASDI